MIRNSVGSLSLGKRACNGYRACYKASSQGVLEMIFKKNEFLFFEVTSQILFSFLTIAASVGDGSCADAYACARIGGKPTNVLIDSLLEFLFLMMMPCLE